MIKRIVALIIFSMILGSLLTFYYFGGEDSVIVGCGLTDEINFSIEGYYEYINGSFPENISYNDILSDDLISFGSFEPEWELCSPTGFWVATCYSGSPCDRYRTDSTFEILNMTEENCKKADALVLEGESGN